MAVGGGTEMAAVAQPVEKVSDLLQKLKIDTPKIAGSKLQNTGSLENGGDVPGFPVMIDSCHTNGTYKIPMESVVYYTGHGYAAPHGYVYDYSHGFEPPLTGEWIEYPGCIGMDGAELHNAVPYSETGSMLYHSGGFGYPAQPLYIPYSTAPIATIGADGQFYGPPAFQYPGPVYQQALSPAPQYFPSTVMVTGDAAATRKSVPDNSCGMIAYGNMMTMGSRPTYPVAMLPPQNSYIGGVIPFSIPSTTPQDVRPSFDGFRPSSGWPDIPKSGQLIPGNPGVLHTLVSQPASGPGRTSQNIRPTNKPVQVYAPIPQSPQVPARVTSPRIGPGSLARGYAPSSQGVPNSNTAQKISLFNVESSANGNGRLLTGMDRCSLQGRRMNPSINGNGCNSDILNEQNRGPRTTKVKIQASPPVVFRHPRVQNGSLHEINDGNKSLVQEQYNRSDFITTYSNAKLFVIKSYSEDDVHKSIKYGIWTSTPNGNKRLEAAYEEALTRAAGKKGGCPVFLLFSVNASGQFCGLAEMVGSVDFAKSVDYWQQDKWSGQFAVKWHIIKDIPNSQFRHIILENNENKPVTNSRDTQEIKFEKGMEMLNIFKNYPLRACILDDFQFYENRQKAMQEKRTVPQHQHQHQQQQQQQQQQQVLDQGINEQQKLDETSRNMKAEQNAENVVIDKCYSCGSTAPDGTVSGQSDSS